MIDSEKLIKELIDNEYKREEVKDIACKILRMIKRYDEAAYNRLALKIHEIIYGPYFDEHMAKEAVAEMKNFDGSSGEHWSMEQTNNLATQNNIKVNMYDWYYLLNMLHSDAGQIFKNDLRTYIDFANSVYLKDPDGHEGKIFDEYVAKHYELY